MEIRYDLSALAHIGEVFKRAGQQAPNVVRLAVNHAGAKAVTAMRSALVDQTGLKRKTLVKAVKGGSTAGGYVIKSHGGNIRLKFFAARETRKGVSAAPWNARRVYPGTFIKGGRFPKRVGLNMGGQVMQRTGSGRLPLRGVKSGLFIPTEMVQGQSEAAFYRVLDTDLAPRLQHELSRILGG